MPIGLGLAGACIDEVDRYPFETVLRHSDRLQGLVRAMQPTEETQRLVVQALNPQRHAIDPRRCKIGEIRGFDAAGIGFESDFDVMREAPQLLRFAQQTRDEGRGHERRRSSAEKDTCERFFRICLKMFVVHIGQQGIAPLLRVGRFADMAVEIAIGAFGDAKRPVDIERAGQKSVYPFLTVGLLSGYS